MPYRWSCKLLCKRVVDVEVNRQSGPFSYWHQDFQKAAFNVNEMEMVSILTVYSNKDNAFYTRHESDINVV